MVSDSPDRVRIRQGAAPRGESETEPGVVFTVKWRGYFGSAAPGEVDSVEAAARLSVL